MEENNTNNITETTIVSDNRVDEIVYNTSVIANCDLFIVAFLVVIVVCYILWKSLDNFISY